VAALGRQGARRFVSLLAGAVFCLFVAETTAGNAPEEHWEAPLGQDHPLVGRIWDVAAGQFMDQTTLVDHLQRSRYVLLGEKHDNPDHHRLQAWLLRALIAAGRRPVVGFEMFTVADAPALERHLAAHPNDAAGLAEAVNWSGSGWPAWVMYLPIAEAALQAHLPILATNLAPATVQSLEQHGVDALDATLVSRLELDQPIAADTQATMALEIREGHCGYASEVQIKAMILVQRARDAQMAERLMAGQQDGAVLIAGAGHARRDFGIPRYLAHKAAGAMVIAVAFLEVSQDLAEPSAYATQFHRQTLPFDFVWFTPRLDDQDPCEAFQEQLQKLERKK
jgi:uncharacterized iron-regulated protein